ncbi:hypothetical protein BFO_3192 [Tannerella forsythia 92A2]|uniref:Uncharacterized protein n=1 Tax=Tannerella forsythia (strain ATCC 43037 / JCM 10827 / CCUG 21028 A / KCTC 5666 / FDC 338) TaxID=203275 RepID=G8UI30_TANFA|nr:hypothetical protein BFO_3192 [Tannerella forsythia 92A2]
MGRIFPQTGIGIRTGRLISISIISEHLTIRIHALTSKSIARVKDSSECSGFAFPCVTVRMVIGCTSAREMSNSAYVSVIGPYGYFSIGCIGIFTCVYSRAGISLRVVGKESVPTAPYVRIAVIRTNQIGTCIAFIDASPRPAVC